MLKKEKKKQEFIPKTPLLEYWGGEILKEEKEE